MEQNLINTLNGKTTFIVGNDKNAGKTTFLNYSLHLLRKKTEPAFLSVGVDGEEHDQISGMSKPQVFTCENDYLVTTDSMLKKSPGLFRVMQSFPYKTVLGKIVLVKTLRGGSIELVGPENNAQLKEILAFIKEDLRVKTILIDGAVNRLTQVSSSDKAGFVYVFKISRSNLNSSLRKLKTLSLIKNIGGATSADVNSKNSFVLEGALTSAKLRQVPEDSEKLILTDFTRIFISHSELTKLQKGLTILFENDYPMNFAMVNLYDISRDEFDAHLKDNNVVLDILYNPFQTAAAS